MLPRWLLASSGIFVFFFFNDTATTEIYTLSLHDALPISSDVGAIPFVYTDYRPVKDPKNRAEYAAAWGVPPESLSLNEGLMVTEIVKEESGVRGMYIMGENPVISDPDVAHAEHWFQELEFLAVHDLFLT